MERKLLDFLKNEAISLREMEPLSNHTSFRIGGPARWFAMPETGEQLTALLSFVVPEIQIYEYQLVLPVYYLLHLT